MLLGDMGAEVIKVESFEGDDPRKWGPPFVQGNGHKESAYYLGLNRNKKSMCINFKKPQGLDLIRNLAQKSDVLVENYVPGKLAQYGLDYESLKKINPRLIYASISGYGPTGPSSKRAGYDVIIEAEAGLMHITGEKGGDPVKVGVAVTDIATGLFTHSSILAALFARERGLVMSEKIDVSLLETQVACLANIAHSYLLGGVEAERWGTQHPSIVPYQGFKTLDGHIVVGAGNDKQFKVLCEILEVGSLAEDPQYKTNSSRVANRENLIKRLSEVFSAKTTEQWVKLLEDSGIPFGPINNMAETFSHPQVLHRNMIEKVPHPLLGTLQLLGIPVKFTNSQQKIKLHPPILGEHTDEVLKSVLNLSDQSLSNLKQKEAIK
ncbi:hypothetical protein HDU96_001711 [Phlyctochytrium bullatum]|nr:hypothetical protein HDU96_001711 [Phlyctochytrium bullatum]